jgi:hypothetical protein
MSFLKRNSYVSFNFVWKHSGRHISFVLFVHFLYQRPALDAAKLKGQEQQVSKISADLESLREESHSVPHCPR